VIKFGEKSNAGNWKLVKQSMYSVKQQGKDQGKQDVTAGQTKKRGAKKKQKKKGGGRHCSVTKRNPRGGGHKENHRRGGLTQWDPKRSQPRFREQRRTTTTLVPK